MTTKETFLSLGIGELHKEAAEKIDFDALDHFVTMFIVAYMNKRGTESIREDLSEDAISPTTNFLTRMIEVGAVQFLAQNNLIIEDEEATNELAIVVANGINISMASELQLNDLDPLGSNMFFEIRALFGLIQRVIDHINRSRRDTGYIFSLVSLNLQNFVNPD